MKWKSPFIFLLVLSGLLGNSQIPGITTQVSPTSFCPGDLIRVSFLTTDTFISGNLFTIQLSDTSGDFANSTILDTISGQSSDTLFITAPTIIADTRYLIRVIASNPPDTGNSSVNNLTFRPVLGAPNAHLTPSGSADLCQGDSIKLRLDSIPSLSTSWWLNGQPVPFNNRFYRFAKDSGLYLVKFTDTLAQGCSTGFDSVLITVRPNPAQPTITASGPTSFCESGSVILSTALNPDLNFQWTDHGNELSADTTENFTADTSGEYRIVVTDSFSCSATSDSVLVLVHLNPVVTLNFVPDSICIASPPVFITGGLPLGGTYSDLAAYVTANQFYPNLSGLGTFAIYYAFTDSFGCSNADTADLRITNCPVPSVLTQVTPSSFCQGDIMNISFFTSDPFFFDNIFTVQLSDSLGNFSNAMVLDTVNRETGATLQIPAPLVPAGTHYKIRVIASDPIVNGVPGLNDLTFRRQLSPPNAHLTVSGSTSFCTGDSVKLKLDSLSFLSTAWWFNGTSISTPGRFHTYAKDSGLYLVRFTDTVATGCSRGADSVLIGVHNYPVKPVITAGGPTKICGTGLVTLTASFDSTHTLTYRWTSYGNTITGANARTYIADTTGQYKVIATSPFNCSALSDSMRVNINPKPVVTFDLYLDSFCLHAPPIHLEGGLPEGGFYSGNFVSTTTFNQNLSGLGTYTVYYTYVDSIGCTDKDSTTLQIFDCTTSSAVEDLAGEMSWAMYPNPASGAVTFAAERGRNCRFRIFTLTGMEIAESKFSGHFSFSAKTLAAGTYMVEITDLSRQTKSVKRLIIQ